MSKVNQFQLGWERIELPIQAIVAIVDEGEEPFVGLSAMQLNALGLHSGVVTFQNGPQEIEARTWNCFGVNSTPSENYVRITEGVARTLNCEEGDEILFVKAVPKMFPVYVGSVLNIKPSQN